MHKSNITREDAARSAQKSRPRNITMALATGIILGISMTLAAVWALGWL